MDLLIRTDRGKPDVVQQSKGIARRQVWPGMRPGIAEPAPGRGAIVVLTGEPNRVLDPSLIAGAPLPRGADPGNSVEDAITTAHDGVLDGLPREPETRLEIREIRIVVIAISVARENFSSCQRS